MSAFEMGDRIRVLLSIRSLNCGGAERQFIELANGIDKSRFQVSVCTMYQGLLDNELRDNPDISFFELKKSGRYDFLGFLLRYRKVIQKVQPEVIYSFLPEMNVFSVIASFRLKNHPKIIWGFRASNMDLSNYDFMARKLFSLQRLLSSFADLIVSNSFASLEYHRFSGFNVTRAKVIHNGTNLNTFKRSSKLRKEFRELHGLKESDFAIGIASRLDLMKGHVVLAKAAVQVLRDNENLYFFSAGEGECFIRKQCEEILGEFKDRFKWLGLQKNMVSFYSGIDFGISASIYGEGFSNSIAEAMACEVPVIGTDVGDTKFIILDNDFLVYPNDEKSLKSAIEKILKADLKQLSIDSRSWIEKHFTVEEMIRKSERILEGCINR